MSRWNKGLLQQPHHFPPIIIRGLAKRRRRAAERAEVSLERVLRELAAIAFSNITKAVTWSCEEGEDGQRVKILLVPRDKLDEGTAAAISAVSQSSTGTVRIRMHNKLQALVALGSAPDRAVAGTIDNAEF